jgi:hypothetical protein
MDIPKARESLSLAVNALRQSDGNAKVDAIAARIRNISTDLSTGDDSTARDKLETIRTDLARLTSVPPTTAAPGTPISTRAKPQLLPGVQTAIDRIGDALDALNGDSAG